VHCLQGDRRGLEQRCPLGRQTEGQLERQAGGGIDREDVRFRMRAGQVDERSRADVVHIASDFLDPPDPLVTYAERIGGDRFTLDEEPAPGVEPLAPKRRCAPPKLQLGALADSADERRRPNLVRHDRAVLVLDEVTGHGSGDEQLARHGRICNRRTAFKLR
jgi:hypothetical protein